MRINKLTIKNFRKITEFEAEFKDVNLLLGKNGVGKTTVINAISWLLTGKSFLDKAVEVKPVVQGNVNKGVITEVIAQVEKDDVELELVRKFDENNTTQIIVRNLKTGAIDTMKVREFEKFTVEELGFDKVLFNPSILFDGSWNSIRNWIIEKFDLTPTPNAPYLPKFEKYDLKDAYDNRTIDKVVKGLKDELATANYAKQQIDTLLSLLGEVPEDVLASLQEFETLIAEKEEELKDAESVQKIVKANIKMLDSANTQAFEKANELLKEIDPDLELDAKKKRVVYKNSSGESIPYPDLSTGEKLRFAITLNNIFYEKGYRVPLVLDELGVLTGGVEVKNQLFGTDAAEGLDLFVETHEIKKKED